MGTRIPFWNAFATPWMSCCRFLSAGAINYGACDPASDPERDGNRKAVGEPDSGSAARSKLPVGKRRLCLSAGCRGKIQYEEIPDRKSGKLVPGLKFSSEDQVALDYRRIQETFGTDFYYA